MAIFAHEDPAVLTAVDRYIESQKHADRLISTQDAVQALRTVLAKCYLSDRGLAELVAATAIVHGQNVSFDLVAEEERTTNTTPKMD